MASKQARAYRVKSLTTRTFAAMKVHSIVSKSSLKAHLHIAQTRSIKTLGALQRHAQQKQVRARLAEAHAFQITIKSTQQIFSAWARMTSLQRVLREKRRTAKTKLRVMTQKNVHAHRVDCFQDWKQVVKSVKVERWALGWWAQKSGSTALLWWLHVKRVVYSRKLKRYAKVLAARARLHHGFRTWSKACRQW